MAFTDNTPIDDFVQSMYNLSAISEDTYDTMRKLENTTPHDQQRIFFRLLMDDNRNPIRYRNFKEGLKKINSYKSLYYQILFVGEFVMYLCYCHCCYKGCILKLVERIVSAPSLAY